MLESGQTTSNICIIFWVLDGSTDLKWRPFVLNWFQGQANRSALNDEDAVAAQPLVDKPELINSSSIV